MDWTSSVDQTFREVSNFSSKGLTAGKVCLADSLKPFGAKYKSQLRTNYHLKGRRPYIGNCVRDGQRRNIDNRYSRVAGVGHIRFPTVWGDQHLERIVSGG